MTAFRVLLVDDEPLAISRLQAAFREMPDTDVVGVANDGETAAVAIRDLRPDLVILDVQMPGLDGVTVARTIDDSQETEVVFVTAFGRYATDAFEIDATDYLVKPVRFDRLRAAVAKARRRKHDRRVLQRTAELEGVIAGDLAPVAAEPAAEPSRYDSEIWVPGRGGLQRVATTDIVWIEASRDYVLLHTASRSHILRATMAALQDRLDPAIMLRVHRSAFVRRDAVARIIPAGKGLIALSLSDDTTVQVGPSYTRQVIAALRRS